VLALDGDRHRVRSIRIRLCGLRLSVILQSDDRADGEEKCEGPNFDGTYFHGGSPLSVFAFGFKTRTQRSNRTGAHVAPIARRLKGEAQSIMLCNAADRA
jgi:hypothetical protein